MTKDAPKQEIIIELSAVIVGVQGNAPHVLVTHGHALPSGPLTTKHSKLEQALREWVAAQTGLQLGYVEQLYTFADKDRATRGRRVISIGYLALTTGITHGEPKEGQAVDWYRFFPWEDHRAGWPDAIMAALHRALTTWKNKAPTTALRQSRAARIAIHFPSNPRDWNDELVLGRYELLWEAGLVEEAAPTTPLAGTGLAMAHDHRRILATAMARLRAKIKYRPVVFELLPAQFTLLELQHTVEALAGLRLHKQNFRRLVLTQGLVEETKAQARPQRGRPAQLFAFRRAILATRAVAGTKLPRGG
ncbi:MAG: hypothetical protein PHW63_07860 [Alphaproteobacteria bacterium]|nr:hypothetical protein [Alphaproteobacteria bacterium]